MSIAELRKKGQKARKTTGNGLKRPPVVPPGFRGTTSQQMKREEFGGKHLHPNTVKFTQEVVDILISSIEAGNYFTTAAHLAGISLNSFYRWLHNGQDALENGQPDDPFAQFYAQIMEAEAKAESKLVHIVRTHAENDWRPGMELLSRRFPDKWGNRQKTELTGAGGGPVELVVVYDDSPDGEVIDIDD